MSLHEDYVKIEKIGEGKIGILT